MGAFLSLREKLERENCGSAFSYKTKYCYHKLEMSLNLEDR